MVTSDELLDTLRTERLCAIVRSASSTDADRRARLVLGAGARVVEVALTTPDACRVIEGLRADFGEALIGAGTVLTADDVDRVRAAGAQFAVTPGGVAQVRAAAASHLPVLAGAMTATEALAVLEAGACAVKLFPASLGGPAYLKALRDPLPTVPFIPVGGVALDSLADWFGAGAIAVGVGSPLVGRGEESDDLVTARAEVFVRACRVGHA